jgi:hypothetical protein
MNTFPAYKHALEIIPGVSENIVFRISTVDYNTGKRVTSEEYSVVPVLDLNGMKIRDFINANFDIIAAQNLNIEKLKS